VPGSPGTFESFYQQEQNYATDTDTIMAASSGNMFCPVSVFHRGSLRWLLFT
jgi:hypothetical protein